MTRRAHAEIRGSGAAQVSTDQRARMRGTSMVELLIAIAVVGVAVMVQVQQITVTLREFNIDLETQFAFHKASGMLAELQASVDAGVIDTPERLESVMDVDPNPFLTTRVVATPDHVMSGNSTFGNGAWHWYRAVSVDPIDGAEHSRFVRVRVFRADASGHRTVAALASGVLSVTVRAEPVVQEFDVYALAIAGAPSLWRPLPELRAEVASLAGAIEGANPDLRLRLHWITSMGYGRDPLYVPYVNEAEAADAAAPWTYWYPGKLGAGAGASRLFAADLFGGRVRTEAGVLHDFDATDNPYPYAVADRFNHCVRTPEARAIFALRVAAGLEKADEPPLQVLLADMCADPERYRNAIVLNLHGEGLPFPPLRNYSDAARDPEGHPGVRVVTHPARLHTPSASATPVEFRVYAYKTDPDVGPAVLDEPITVQIFGGDFRPWLTVDAQVGGVDITTGQIGTGSILDRTYSFGVVCEHSQTHQAYEMNYEVGYADTPQPHTFVRLYNTPLVCAPELGGSGIQPTARLYGMDYIPSPVQNIGGFYAMTNPSPVPIAKNTARWRVRVAPAGLANVFGPSAMVTATTRIGTDLTTGAMWPTAHLPHDVTTTYAWWSPDPADVPVTERYQFLGDARHNPYLDLCVGGTFAHAYNWWFDDLRDGSADVRSQWTALDTSRLHDGFGFGTVADVPRILQVWREALQSAHAVFCNPGGVLAGRLLLGGEVLMPGDARTAQPTVVTVHGDLYATSTVQGYRDDLGAQGGTPDGSGGTSASLTNGAERAAIVSTSGFLALPWLGELAPDSAYLGYSQMGNLATLGGFHHALTGTANLARLPRGTTWNWSADSTLAAFGGASFLQCGPDSATFTQVALSSVKTGATASLSDEVYAFTQAVGVAIPQTTSADLGWTLTGSLGTPLPQRAWGNDFPTQSATALETFAASASGQVAGGVIRLEAPGGGGHAAYVVPFAETPSSVEEQRALVHKSLAFGLRALFVAGEPDRIGPEPVLPTVQVESPGPATTLVAPDSVPLRWGIRFGRFDGRAYTERYPTGWAGSELGYEYVLTYRKENDVQSYNVADGSPAEPGVRPANPALCLADTGLGSESYVVPLPGDRFPAGAYFFRVDCFHAGAGLHVAHHEVKVRVKR